MSGPTNFLAAVNSLVRTLLALIVVGGVGVGGWYGYTTYNAGEIEAKRRQEELDAKNQELARQRDLLEQNQRQLAAKDEELARKEELIASQGDQIQELHKDVEIKQKEIDKLDAAIRLLKVDRLLAEIIVLDQKDDPETGKKETTVQFRELNEEGQPIGPPRVFHLKGDTVYIDAWIVKFDDKYIEQADLLRSTSLCLFKSIYGNVDGPEGSYPLQESGSRPLAYASGGKMTDFERKIWDDFWSIANDPEKARKLGIRAAHGQANFTKVQKGKRYRWQLRASDGLTTLPAEDVPAGDQTT